MTLSSFFQLKKFAKRSFPLLIWIILNFVIFLACYLNYRIQLKHRYLYKILSDGLCFSRAAAMVINFNLLLVWLPMCKYTLTRLAYMANVTQRNLKIKHEQSQLEIQVQQQEATMVISNYNRNLQWFKSLLAQLLRSWRLFKISLYSNFLIAADNSTSLHTICAATITIASVIHTIAHILNVINFSRNYDPFLSTLNMANYAGQAPIELLLSVPGITGSLMLVILALMTFSSVTKIRSKSFNLFQIIHKLSVLFVILLFLHPINHVLKEQINVERHHPERCDNRTILSEASNSINYHEALKQQEQLKTINQTSHQSELQIRIDANNNANHNPQKMKTKMFEPPPPPPPPPTNSMLEEPRSKWDYIDNNYDNDNPKHITATEPSFKHTHQAQPPPPDDQTKLTRKPNSTKESPSVNQNNYKTIRQTDPNRGIPSTRSRYTSLSLNPISLQANTSELFWQSKPLDPQTPELQLSNTITTTTTGAVTRFSNSSSSSSSNSSTSSSSSSRSVFTVAVDVANNKNNSTTSCLDSRPLFVAQSSICWFVLAMGLPCYLLDLFLRKWRRSKSSIQLLGFRSDEQGNLIELILSNNHKRFLHWQPGQFIYLNSPQIASYEWHPFTISSMNNREKQFTLHIKTSGDWTSALRRKLLMSIENIIRFEHQCHQKTSFMRSRESSICCLPMDSNHGSQLTSGIPSFCFQPTIDISLNSIIDAGSNKQLATPNCGPHLNSTPEPENSHHESKQIESKLLFKNHHKPTNLKAMDYNYYQNQQSNSKIIHDYKLEHPSQEQQGIHSSTAMDTIMLSRYSQEQQDSINVHHLNNNHENTLAKELHMVICNNKFNQCPRCFLSQQQILTSSSCSVSSSSSVSSSCCCCCDQREQSFVKLDLYIDGPFHSPFERLLEQQVSVCIANGVGWTAFSSIFHTLINNLSYNNADPGDWWSKWRDFAITKGLRRNLNRTHLREHQINLNPNQGNISKSSFLNETDAKNKQIFIRPIECRIHIMIIVPDIDQLKPFFALAINYFNHMYLECQIHVTNVLNPIRCISAYLTRTQNDDFSIKDFCAQEKLEMCPIDNSITVNDVFRIHLGKPSLDDYLRDFRLKYPDKQKISVYCCGSNQVKRGVRDVCKTLNRSIEKLDIGQYFSYHEENF